MRIAFLLGLLFFVTQLCAGQKPVEIKNFTPAQKKEWNTFLEYWNGNGRGTCTPMMEVQIDTGKCTKFGFIADLTIGENGKIKKVKLLKNKTVCVNKAVQKELLKCFIDAIKTEPAKFKALKGFTVLNASL